MGRIRANSYTPLAVIISLISRPSLPPVYHLQYASWKQSKSEGGEALRTRPSDHTSSRSTEISLFVAKDTSIQHYQGRWKQFADGQAGPAVGGEVVKIKLAREARGKILDLAIFSSQEVLLLHFTSGADPGRGGGGGDWGG